MQKLTGKMILTYQRQVMDLQMARGDSLYARLDVDFIRSYRWLKLNPGSRCLYLFLWVHALELRRETIPRPDNYFLASQAGLPRHPIASYLRLLHDSKLLNVNGSTIQVVGIAEKHKQFQWKSAPNGERIGPIQSPNVPLLTERNGTERNGTERNGTKKKTPKAKDFSSDFLEFWNYKLWTGTRRGSKEDAQKLWRYWKVQGELEDIWTATRNYSASNPPPEFIPAITAYLAKKHKVRNHWTAWLKPPETEKSRNEREIEELIAEETEKERQRDESLV